MFLHFNVIGIWNIFGLFTHVIASINKITIMVRKQIFVVGRIVSVIEFKHLRFSLIKLVKSSFINRATSKLNHKKIFQLNDCRIFLSFKIARFGQFFRLLRF